MWDRKAANIMLGVGGAYCDLCTAPKEHCCIITRVQHGFEINRTVENSHAIFEELVQDDGVTVTKARGDYSGRTGVTTKPIVEQNIWSVQVLHLLLRSFDHFMKIVVRVHASVHEWTDFESMKIKPPVARFVINSKREIQQQLKEVGKRWDFPDSAGKGGTTTTGPVAKSILHDEAVRNYLLNDPAISSQQRTHLKEYGQRLSVVL